MTRTEQVIEAVLIAAATICVLCWIWLLSVR